MELQWVKDHDEQYSADSGNRTYIVCVFNVGAYDGDPTLTMYTTTGTGRHAGL